jgi:hypothetical protein
MFEMGERTGIETFDSRRQIHANKCLKQSVEHTIILDDSQAIQRTDQRKQVFYKAPKIWYKAKHKQSGCITSALIHTQRAYVGSCTHQGGQIVQTNLSKTGVRECPVICHVQRLIRAYALRGECCGDYFGR